MPEIVRFNVEMQSHVGITSGQHVGFWMYFPVGSSLSTGFDATEMVIKKQEPVR